MPMKFDFSKQSESFTLPDLPVALDRLEQAVPGFDALVLTSKDPYLSEYVSRGNNLRFGATRFTGSVGDAVYFTKNFRARNPGLKPLALFVDGRYHLQADQEADPALIAVNKVGVESDIEGTILQSLARFPGLKLGMDFERASVASLSRYRKALSETGSSLTLVTGALILEALGLPGWKVDRPIFSLSKEQTGRTLGSNLSALSLALKERAGHSDTLHFTVATDDAAFLLNARGYHSPNQASIMAYTFLLKKELLVFLPASTRDAPVNLDSAQFEGFEVRVIRNSMEELKAALSRHSVKDAFFHAPSMNSLLPELVKELFPGIRMHDDFNWILKTRARKTSEEMASIRSAFLKSSRAIAKTLRWGKAESIRRNLSEAELSDRIYSEYSAEGAVSLSFGTISGAGANSAIVHYGTPSKDVFFDPGKIALLDSGAYYEDGFCTDCTRGFFVGGGASGVVPEAWQKEIYTATLRSAIQAFLHPVDAKLSGKEVDSWIRSKVKEAGYEYLHGTGHGIGIHVHEEGIRLSTASIYPQSAYACVSVEPGIYLSGKGGVRVENVALLIPEGEQHFTYENVAFVGYDWDLVDLSKLTPEEKAYLKAYETKCRELGTELTECPL